MRLTTALVFWSFALPAAAETAFQMPTDEAEAAFISSNVVATFYHELGHAFIDVLQLPVLGREEDAADTLSALLINSIWNEDTATAIIYDTSAAFAMYDAEASTDGAELAFADSHSLDLQRYYNLVCLFYGANPDMRDDVAKELELPEDRAEGCADEFSLAEASWGKLLKGLEPSAKTKGLKMIGVKPGDAIGDMLAAEVEDLNATYGLPVEVSVTVATCGEANAFYYPDDKSITICTEYVQDLQRIWQAN